MSGERDSTALSVRLGLLADFISGVGFPVSEQGLADEEIPFHKVASLKNECLNESTNTVSKETAKKLRARIIPEDSVLMAKVGEAMRLNRFSMNTTKCCIDNNMLAIVPQRELLNSEYLRYVLSTFNIQVFINPGPVPSLDLQGLRMFSIPLPPLETQQRIAEYLDRETAEIDAAVDDLDRYVELLEKRGKMLIEKTVMGGTNSFSPLWSKIRVQNGFAFDSGKFSPNKELPVAKIGDVLPGDFSEFIDSSELPSESFLIKDGDLVLGMSGDFNRTIWNKGKAALNQRVCILKPIADDDIRYISYAIGSRLKKIHSTKFSTTLKNLSTEEILAIRVPHRTVTEQKEIADYLDQETADIDSPIAESTKLRKLLIQRRSALITEVVTGKRQV